MSKILRTVVILLLSLIVTDIHARKKPEPVRLFEAVEFYNNGDMAEAHKILNSIIKDSPDNAAAQYYMGMVRAAMNNIKGAESALRKAIGADTSNFTYKYRLAELYARTDRKELAMVMVENLRKERPYDDELANMLINLYISQHDFKSAIAVLDELESQQGQTSQTVLARFSLISADNRAEEGLDMLLDYYRHSPSSEVSVVLGDYYMSVRNDSLAKVYFSEALAQDNNNFYAQMSMSRLCLLGGDTDGFINCMDSFMGDSMVPSAIKASHMENMLNMMSPNVFAGIRDRLDSLYRRTLETFGSDTVLNSAGALYYFGTDRVDEALELGRKNLSINPDSRYAWEEYLSMLLYSGRWGELEEASQTAIDRLGALLPFCDVNARAKIRNGKYGEAIVIYKKILSENPEDISVIVGVNTVLGDLYNEQGKERESMKCYEKVLKYDPDNVYAMNNYAYLLTCSAKKLKYALEMSSKCVEQEPDNLNYMDTYGWALYINGMYEQAKEVFKRTMIYGGRSNAVILDHYAEVLYALEEYDLSMYYWGLAKKVNDSLQSESDKIKDLDARIAERKASVGK